jgi:hypothetical protein
LSLLLPSRQNRWFVDTLGWFAEPLPLGALDVLGLLLTLFGMYVVLFGLGSVMCRSGAAQKI